MIGGMFFIAFYILNVMKVIYLFNSLDKVIIRAAHKTLIGRFSGFFLEQEK